jgi:2-iminoacetate synthase
MFNEIIKKYDWNSIQAKFVDVHQTDVERVLTKTTQSAYTIEDFLVLISPAAAPFLEQMMELSKRFTLERFGKNMHLFIPMYLSNECQNICTYCGFSFTNKIPRKTLNDAEILQEIEIIKS